MSDVGVDPDPSTYTVGWISAISTEVVAAREFLDKRHGSLPNQAPNDNNIYTLGEIAGHNVVVAVLPYGEYGTSSAATVATDMLRTFENIRIGLMVGVGGGAPTKRDDIRLGDVVVSVPRAGKSGVFQYDYGKAIQGLDFEHTRSLAPPPLLLRAAVNDLKGRFEADGHHIAENIQSILKDRPRLRRKYDRPEQSSDRLYKSSYTHSDPLLSCEDCCDSGTQHIVYRRQRDEYEDNPAIHYGLIASSNQLMKDALLRDKLVEKHHILCFEMEAAGLMNNFPCLVIRGICDYSDTHKDNCWQRYSAMTAAAYTKQLLQLIPPARVQAEQSLVTSIHTLNERLRYVSSHTSAMLAARIDESIMRWLSPPDPSINYDKALTGLQRDSGFWYLTGQKFKQWRNTPNSTLWTTGIPGSGKTSISAAAIRLLWPTCIYFFFDFQDPSKQTLEQLLRSLVFQLYSKPGMPAAHDWLKDGFSALAGDHGRPVNKRLYSALKGMLNTTNDIHIVIDALDESTAQQEMRKFIRSVKFECNVRILLTCRESSYRDWCMKFHDFNLPVVFWQPMSGDGLSREIEAYIRRRVNDENEAWSSGLSPAQIISGVCIKAGGLFRLAVCQLDLLKTCVDEKDLEAELRHLPSTLNDIYTQSLERIPEIQRSKAMRLLSLLAHSTTPLSKKETKHGLAIRTGGRICWEDKLDWRSIQDITLGLTTETTMDIFGLQGEAIQLAHSSVRDFLLSQSKCSFWDLTQSKISTVETCITYLLQVSKENKDTINLFKDKTEAPRALLKSYPFLVWAARHWMKLAGSREVQHAATEQIIELFRDKHAFWLWSACIREQVPRNFTKPLDLASYFDLISVVKTLLDTSSADDDILSAFASVCAQGNWQSAEVLARSRVTPPLHLLEFASSQGDFKLVKALTPEGVTNLHWKVYNALLSKTISSLHGDYEKLISYLVLEKHAKASLDDFLEGDSMNDSFHKLCLKKKTGIIELLTQNGLSFGVTTYKAIFVAREMRAHEIAQLLLQQLNAVTHDELSELSQFQARTATLAERLSSSALGVAPSVRGCLVPLREGTSTREGIVIRARHRHGHTGTDMYTTHTDVRETDLHPTYADIRETDLYPMYADIRGRRACTEPVGGIPGGGEHPTSALTDEELFSSLTTYEIE